MTTHLQNTYYCCIVGLKNNMYVLLLHCGIDKQKTYYLCIIELKNKIRITVAPWDTRTKYLLLLHHGIENKISITAALWD